MRRLFTLLLCITIVLGALAYLTYWHSGWSHINCWTREINIASGHERYTRYWFWRITDRKVTPTWVSTALQSSKGPEDKWRTVVTLSPGTRHSPNYWFHSALGDVKMMEQSFEMFSSPPSVKAELAANLVWLWQHFDDAHEGGRYLTDIVMRPSVIRNERITEQDVPSLKDWLAAYREASKKESPQYTKVIDQAIASLPTNK